MERGGVVVDNGQNAMNPSASPGGTQRSLRTSKPSSRAMQDFNQTGSIIAGSSSDDLMQRPKGSSSDFLTQHQQQPQHHEQQMQGNHHQQHHSQQQQQQVQAAPIPRGADGQPDFTNVLQGNATEYFPALLRNNRYKLVETLQASLFGSVKVAYDAGITAEVAIKISVKSLASHGRARSGAKVLENVKREANVMRYISSIANQRKQAEIMQAAQQLQQQQHSGMDVDQHNGSGSDYHQLATQQWEQLNRKNGHDNVCALIEETDDEYFHYLVTEFVSGGDLHSLLLSLPNHRLPEPQAKYLFRQLAKGVRYLHIHNVAHLDLSLENVCVSNTGKAKIIDFGVAVIHPLAPKHSKRNSTSASNPPQADQQQQQAPASSSAGSSSQSSALLQTFLCSPISNPSQQPGKVGYMSPELYSGRSVWDAYSNDIFALGVILYCLLTGRPPFSYPSSQDPWFNFIASGHWIRLLEQAQKLGLAGVGGNEPQNAAHAAEKLSDAEKSQFQYVHIYSHLSPEALDLIDHILKPQHKRLGIDAILAHPWLQPAQQQ